jgi:formamidopyrimidine-DNA glycosylase
MPARATADFYLANTPTCGVPYWDTGAPGLAHLGDYLSRLAVYGREGEQCRRCGGVVERVVVRGRSSHWCRGCQR